MSRLRAGTRPELSSRGRDGDASDVTDEPRARRRSARARRSAARPRPRSWRASSRATSTLSSISSGRTRSASRGSSYTLLRDPAEADGVAQDVFVKAFRALPEFKGESAFETWLTRIAINTVRDHIRRRRPSCPSRSCATDDDDDGPELPPAFDPADGTSPERDLLSRRHPPAHRRGARARCRRASARSSS